MPLSFVQVAGCINSLFLLIAEHYSAVWTTGGLFFHSVEEHQVVSNGLKLQRCYEHSYEAFVS